MEKDLISIVVLIYNTEPYLKRCMDSIVQQTYKNIEIICIIDGSKDNCASIIKEYADQDTRIKIIQRENKGQSYSRIEGYEKAEGKYLVYVDSDDWIAKNMIEIMHQKAVQYQVDLVRCNHVGYKNGKMIPKKPAFKTDTMFSKADFEPMIYDLLYNTIELNVNWKQMIKKEKMKQVLTVNPDLRYGEDLCFNIAILQQIDTILFIPDALYIYYINESGITKNVNSKVLQKKLQDVIEVYGMLFDTVEQFPIKEQQKYKRLAAIRYFYQLLFILKDYILYEKQETIRNFLKDNLYQNAKCDQIKAYLKDKQTIRILKKKYPFYMVKMYQYLIHEDTNHLIKYTKGTYYRLKKWYHMIKK